MLESFKTVYEGGVGEITEKKSRFIANVVPVDSEAAAIEFIEQTKKKYQDATHNCSAYVIGQHDEIQRCSDDGEPAKTAGWPMLDVLLREKLHNTAVVVTRYFGGTLLGTGGLVHAYQEATKEGLKNSVIIEKKLGGKLLITTDYNGIGKLQYIAAQMELTSLKTEYTDIVTLTILVPTQQLEEFKKKVTEATGGKATIEDLGNAYYANVSGEILLFED
ncbi:MAG: hypothetical protein K0R92_879 [Lachnospiraceae bacterium]|jgi:uncharacterized YigZ family protein|nr:hypothetical protein [Lachnospiraceae bacterium]